MRPELEREPLRLPPLLALTALGVALRFVLLLVVGELELQSDESNYIYLAIAWDHFGVYFDHHRYLWPPGYSWLLAELVGLYGAGSILAIKVTQVLASASIGLTTMLFAHRLGSMRAARIAGVIWILYLPLAAYTHLLWNETLFLAMFLPGLYLCLAVLQDGAERGVDRRLILAGLCFGGALYMKEAPTYLIPAVALLLMPFSGGVLEGLRRASLVLGVTFVVVLPWCLRNLEVYGHFVLADSMGENAYNGLNEAYVNFDLIPVDKERGDRKLPLLVAYKVVRHEFVAAPLDSGWRREERGEFHENELVNTVERSEAMTASGLDYVSEHPGWFLRSRVKKLADLLTPLSFYTRHLALGHYDERVLGGPVARKLTGLWAVACPLLLLLLGSAGFFTLADPRGRLLVGLVLGYTLATSMLVAMSRFRIPIVPLLIVCAAVLLARERPVRRPLTTGATLGCWGVLIFLWWVNWPEVWTIFSEMIWKAEA